RDALARRAGGERHGPPDEAAGVGDLRADDGGRGARRRRPGGGAAGGAAGHRRDGPRVRGRRALAVAVREILRYPHRALKTPAREAADPAEVERVTRDLLDTMESFGHCVGIAAPQLGELVRIAVVDVRGHRKALTDNGRLVLWNPRA